MLGEEAKVLLGFLPNSTPSSSQGYVAFGRFDDFNCFDAGSGRYNFVQEFYNGDLQHLLDSDDDEAISDQKHGKIREMVVMIIDEGSEDVCALGIFFIVAGTGMIRQYTLHKDCNSFNLYDLDITVHSDSSDSALGFTAIPPTPVYLLTRALGFRWHACTASKSLQPVPSLSVEFEQNRLGVLTRALGFRWHACTALKSLQPLKPSDESGQGRTLEGEDARRGSEGRYNFVQEFYNGDLQHLLDSDDDEAISDQKHGKIREMVVMIIDEGSEDVCALGIFFIVAGTGMIRQYTLHKDCNSFNLYDLDVINKKNGTKPCIRF
ncbi:hypothetical protein LXL04_034755 [Taraxacum kok-saghyz]